MNWIGCILTVYALTLCEKKNINCWPVWIVGSVLFIAHFLLQARIEWAFVILNSVFILQNLKGWIKWRDDKLEAQYGGSAWQ